jgi:hypothetical protein
MAKLFAIDAQARDENMNYAARREYLAAVLPGLANSSIRRLPELTPTAWAASNL